LGPSDISIENFISLRRAVKADSLFEGQGFLKCGSCGINRCEKRAKKFNALIKSMSHKTLYKEEVINTFIYFYKQDLEFFIARLIIIQHRSLCFYVWL
jgi:hypothetical protein